MLYRIQKFLVKSLRSQRRLYNTTTSLILKEQLPVLAYQPKVVEKNKYERWERYGLFQPDNSTKKPVFSMVLPPPNVTGKLHLGHALGCTVQDVIVRRKRALGYNVLWVPGTDHAGIATQGIVEKYLQNAKRTSRDELGRDNFNAEVWKWKEKHGDAILNQLKSLGCSLDWSRQMFTMGYKHTRAVNSAFIDLFDRGLVYRKLGLVNWCKALNSTVSDIEVDSLEIKCPTELTVPGYKDPVRFGQMFHFAYKIFGTNNELVVATTMPETMLGDVAVAIHPDDERYKHLAGKRVFHPFRNITLPIIMDESVDMKLGTGVVKITPAHSKVDYDIAEVHKLPLLQVIDEKGTIINSPGFNGRPRYDCRDDIVKKLTQIGLMRDIVPHQMTLPVCSRTGDIIECLPKEQWFMSCRKLNEKAREAVSSGQLNIEPEKYVKNWIDWTGKDRDWCISRQLWWGHQIPAYKCAANGHFMWAAANNEKEAKERASKYLRAHPDDITVERDEDVLDTWFSSAIYPFTIFGWPDKTVDLEKFFPLNLMATGHDILGFWVHKMVMLGLELTDKLPFKRVLLHGIICDGKGAKMSKSKGNVIDPMDIINGISMEKLREKSENLYVQGLLSKPELEKALKYHKSNFSNTNGIPECGVDALRFTLLSQDVKSHFVNFDVSMCHANKLFCNKIWQSVKYLQMACDRLPNVKEGITRDDLTYFDRWILSRLSEMVKIVNTSLESHDFHLATKALRSHIYNEFCDVYLEATKPGFSDRNGKVGYAHAHTLIACLNTSLRCLNPFMCFLTEEVISKLPAFEDNIIFNYNDESRKYLTFPQDIDFNEWKDETLEARVHKVLETAAKIRELKGICGMSNRLKPSIYVKTKDDVLRSDMTKNVPVILNLAQCCNLDFKDFGDKKYIRGILDTESEVWVEILGNDVNSTVSAAKVKLQQKIDKLEKTISNLEKLYSNEKNSTSISEWNKLMGREKLIAKKQELIQMQEDLGKIRIDFTDN